MKDRKIYPITHYGVDPDGRTPEPYGGKPGTVALGTMDTRWMAVKAMSACALGATPEVPVAVGVVSDLTAPNDMDKFAVGAGSGWFATAPFKAGEFGWVYKHATV